MSGTARALIRPSGRACQALMLAAVALLLLAAAANASRLTVKVAALDEVYQGPGGIVLWSNGRSGTSAFWDSLHLWCSRGKVPVDALCGTKEGFRTKPPSTRRIDSCFSAVRPDHTWFTHIKPGHLSGDSDLASAKDLLAKLQRHGAKVLVVIRRTNWLARTVSSAELFFRHDKEKSVLGSAARNSAMFDYFRRFSKDEVSPAWTKKLADRSGEKVDEGEIAARELGYRVITFKYSKQDWPCKQAMSVLKAANEEGVLGHLPFAACKPSHAMGQWSHRTLSLEERVGPQAAALIRKNMEGTEYEWMLDLGRETPP